MWPDYIRLDPQPVRSLAETTYTWQDSVDEALAELAPAETLIAEPIGVSVTLSQIGTDGGRWAPQCRQRSTASDSWTPAMDGFVVAPPQSPQPAPPPGLSAEL